MARVRSTDDGIDGKDSVGLYLEEIARTPLLTAEEEVELAETVEAGLLDPVELDGIYELAILNELLAAKNEPEVAGL